MIRPARNTKIVREESPTLLKYYNLRKEYILVKRAWHKENNKNSLEYKKLKTELNDLEIRYLEARKKALAILNRPKSFRVYGSKFTHPSDVDSVVVEAKSTTDKKKKAASKRIEKEIKYFPEGGKKRRDPFATQKDPVDDFDVNDLYRYK